VQELSFREFTRPPAS